METIGSLDTYINSFMLVLKFEEFASKFGSILEPNNKIENLAGWTSDEIFEKTGIKQRFISDHTESSESLALDAIKKISEKHLSECDLIAAGINILKSMGFSMTVAHFGINSELELKR